MTVHCTAFTGHPLCSLCSLLICLLLHYGPRDIFYLGHTKNPYDNDDGMFSSGTVNRSNAIYSDVSSHC